MVDFRGTAPADTTVIPSGDFWLLIRHGREFEEAVARPVALETIDRCGTPCLAGTFDFGVIGPPE